MDRTSYRELWQIRFKKMLHLETKSVAEYESLLAHCLGSQGDREAAAHLAGLIADEKKHVELVKELLGILDRQAD